VGLNIHKKDFAVSDLFIVFFSQKMDDEMILEFLGAHISWFTCIAWKIYKVLSDEKNGCMMIFTYFLEPDKTYSNNILSDYPRTS
jgi:hypothetical protein